MYTKLSATELRKFNKLYLDLPPMPNKSEKVISAIEQYEIPILFLVQSETIDPIDASDLIIPQKYKEEFLSYFKFFGKVSDDVTLEEFYRSPDYVTMSESVEGSVLIDSTSQETALIDSDTHLGTDVADDVDTVDSDTVDSDTVDSDTVFTDQISVDSNLADSQDSLITANTLNFSDSHPNFIPNGTDDIVTNSNTDCSSIQLELDALKETYANLLTSYNILNRDVIKKDSTIDSLELEKFELISAKTILEKEIAEVNAVCVDKINAIKLEYSSLVGSFSEDDSNVSTNKLVLDARINKQKILGIFGNTRTFISQLLDPIDSIITLDSPSDFDVAVLCVVPLKASIEFANTFLLENKGKRIILVLNMWNDSLSFDPNSLFDTKVDFIFDYNKKLFEDSLMGDDDSIRLYMDRDLVRSLNERTSVLLR